MRKLVFVLVMSMMPFAANAEWVAGIGYYNISDDDSSIDISLGAIAASVGFRFETFLFDSGGSFAIIPELRVGTGVGDDTLSGVKVEIDKLLALTVRGQYDFASGVYLFGAPSYANLDLKASGGGFSASGNDSEFGFAVGFGFPVSDNLAAELSYESYDGADIIGGALKIRFK